MVVFVLILVSLSVCENINDHLNGICFFGGCYMFMSIVTHYKILFLASFHTIDSVSLVLLFSFFKADLPLLVLSYFQARGKPSSHLNGIPPL